METGRARNTDPITSHDAANKVDANKLERVVVDCLHVHGPLTIKEISAKTGVHVWSISPRMAPLREKGFVEDSGEPHRGRSIVWKLKEKIWPQS